MTEINRFGICPNCSTNWRGGDIFTSLASLSCNSHRPESELIKMAANYGWTVDNRVHFSNTISHEVDGKTLLECPKITCGHIFNRYTGEEYRNMFDAQRGIVIIKNIGTTISTEVVQQPIIEEDDLF